MNRGKRPSHAAHRTPSQQKAKAAAEARKPSGRPPGDPKRPRYEDTEAKADRRDKPKGVAFAAPKTKPKRDIVVPERPFDGKGKKPSRADAAEPIVLSPSTAPPPRSFTIIAGSYEKLLYGLDGSFHASSLKGEKPSKPELALTPIFIFPAHVSCVKAVGASPQGGKWLATGSTDETVKVWDLRRRKEIGGLMQHQGSITHVSFPSRSHLITASEDGTLCLFHCRDWALLRTLKGHKGRVNCTAVHPSGKLALSVGQDRTIRMWDLMRGKGAASTKLGKEGELVRWSATGKHFALQSQNTIDIYRVNMSLIQTIEHPSRINDIRFCTRSDATSEQEEVLLVAGEDKKVSVYEAHEAPPSEDEDDDDDDDEERLKYRIIAEFVGHENRVKAIDTIKMSLPSDSTTIILATASSDGKIRVFDLTNLPPRSAIESPVKIIEAETSYDTKGTRLTCLALADGEPARGNVPRVGEKRKEVESDDSAGEKENESEGEEEGEDEDEDEEE